MSKFNLYTASGARLTRWKSTEKSGSYQLVLVPGGPGMGSEYFEPLIQLLLDQEIEIWTLDLPGNGDNAASLSFDYSKWSTLLPEVFDLLDHVIFLGHSFGGMLLLSEQTIEKRAKALILIGSLPETIFNNPESPYSKKLSIKKARATYLKRPSDESLQNFLIQLAPLYFKPENLEQAVALFSRLSCANKAYNILSNTFLKTYRAQYIPKIPTLLLSGDADIVTPIEHFENHPQFGQPPFVMAKIKNANHYPWIDNPEETQESIINFLQILR